MHEHAERIEWQEAAELICAFGMSLMNRVQEREVKGGGGGAAQMRSRLGVTLQQFHKAVRELALNRLNVRIPLAYSQSTIRAQCNTHDLVAFAGPEPAYLSNLSAGSYTVWHTAW